MLALHLMQAHDMLVVAPAFLLFVLEHVLRRQAEQLSR